MTINSSKITYLDHNATTPIKPAVLELMQEILRFSGNASSIHKAGRESRRLIETARTQIAATLNTPEKSVIVFTSGATEANNLVLKGSGCERVLVSGIEHPSVLNAMPSVEKIPVLGSGIVDLGALDKMLVNNDRSTLISVMMVNNETGVIQPIKEIVAIAKKRGALVHTDAVQAIGRIPVDIAKLGIDYLTASSHKIGGPQGVGCLILSNCVSVSPLLSGGNQEKNMRAGTENIAGIVSFGTTVELAVNEIGSFQKLSAQRDKIETALAQHAPIHVFGKDAARVANTSMFAIDGISSETQLIALDLAGICVSNGSACSSGTVKPSHVLKAMGVNDALATTSLRVSLGWNTTEKDTDYFISEWTKMYTRIKTRVGS